MFVRGILSTDGDFFLCVCDVGHRIARLTSERTRPRRRRLNLALLPAVRALCFWLPEHGLSDLPNGALCCLLTVYVPLLSLSLSHTRAEFLETSHQLTRLL